MSRVFRVARSGPTIDGREITPKQIEAMAANYDPKKYGARIFLEHVRAYLPDSAFRAYGDVLSLKVEPDGDAKVLLAEIEPTPDLVKLAADRQKVYWSIEIDPNFASSGEPYMVGLAVTDSPASLGTETLKFSIQHRPAGAPDRLYTTGLEADKTLMAPSDTKSIFTKVKELLAGKANTDDGRFAQIEQSALAIAGELGEFKTTQQKLTDELAGLTVLFTELKTTLANTPQSPGRLKASGGTATHFTDC
ncbi:MAG: GPO family capsid scaffolding protein [Alphaproteobacteria bacterium]|nr:GPO family capsid scaffolding protein [Alphaproteobacteria bacterium]